MSGDCGLTPGMTRRWGLSDAPAAPSLASAGDSILLQGAAPRTGCAFTTRFSAIEKVGGRPIVPLRSGATLAPFPLSGQVSTSVRADIFGQQGVGPAEP